MKPQRQKLITEIVKRVPIANQEQLVYELARFGMHANQATVSRDIKDLGLVKVADPTVGHRYAIADASRSRTTWDAVARTFQEHVSRIDYSEALVVIKTPPGRAHMVAVMLDMLDAPEIVGTVAGDDTLFVVPRTSKILEELVEKFNRVWLGEEARDMIWAGIVGATGYTGLELVRLLLSHPHVDIAFAASRSDAGRPLSDVFPICTDLRLQSVDTVDERDVDVLFLCLPHGTAHPWAVRGLAAGKVVVDLSADHRLRDPGAYRTWYGMDAPTPDVLAQAVYGLTEWRRDELRRATLVANPGCYPTSVLLGVGPLMGHLDGGRIIADCKSGTSGAGRSASVAQLFAEVNENFKPYNVGHMHRHVAEMEQELGPGIGLVFSPHLLPVTRGMLSTLYLPWPTGLSASDIDTLYRTRYADEPFMWILPAGQTATLQHSVHTNRCTISLHPVPEQQTLIVVSVIDNLLKGAAGQAVQSMNVRFGFPETAGLAGAQPVAARRG